MEKREWFLFQSNLDQCKGCRDPQFEKPKALTPARPFRVPSENSILFIGEAPPDEGGFWKSQNDDAIRRLWFPCLQNTHLAALNPDSEEAMDLFVALSFFFVQAMKWPLKKSYDKLTLSSRRLAVEHAVNEHLEDELGMINPRAIIALGNGAWHACSLLAEKNKSTVLKRSGAEKLRGHHYELKMAHRQIPLHVTFLPGVMNERFSRDRIDAIRTDIPIYLDCIEKGGGCDVGGCTWHGRLKPISTAYSMGQDT